MVNPSGSPTPTYDNLPLDVRIPMEELYCLKSCGELPPPPTPENQQEYYKSLRDMINNKKPPASDIDYLRENLADALSKQTRESQLATLKGMKASTMADAARRSR